ncbi:MAG: M6 family metalloprotease domain-containing protein, partial [bacterium]
NDGPDNIPNSGDDDGFVDAVAIVHPEVGGECGAGSTNIWSHAWVYTAWPVSNGSPYETTDRGRNGEFIKIQDYFIVPALDCDGTTMVRIGIFCHEYGHTFGLPDLYDRTPEDKNEKDPDSFGIGRWGLMGLGNWGGSSYEPERPVHMSSWSKQFMGWLDPVNLGENVSQQTISNVEEAPVAFRLWKNGQVGKEYFLLENRHKVGFDSGLSESGLLIWHVDESKLNNGNNNDANHKLIDLEEADGQNDLDNRVNTSDRGDPFPGVGGANNPNRTFNDQSMPNSLANDGSNSLVAVRNISDSGGKMFADLFIKSNLIITTAIPQAVPADGQSSASIIAQLSDVNATNPITFTITSGTASGQLIGANPATPENGQAAITLQATTTPGVVTIEASSPGLTGSSTSVVVYASGSETEVSGAISENTSWTLAGSPYVVTGDVTVKAGVKLTIEPGVTVKLNDNKDIFVNGGLFANGTPNARIIFTANSANPTPGFWGGIQFNEPAIDSICVLNNVIINFGGDIGQAIDHPIVLDPRVNPTITNTTLQHNRTNGIVVKTGAYSSDILLDITGLPYLLFGDFTLNPGAVLRIGPGVILKMGSTTNDLVIRGGLVAEGTNLNPIVFTSIRDDAHGGDSNGDGASSGSPADWGGIEFRETVDDANASLRTCEILYAGAISQAVDYPILLDPRANPAISHTTISSSRVNGIGLKGGNFTSDIRLDITELPYVVPNITIRSGASFAIAPGVLLKMLTNADIRVEGGFSAAGTSNQHIVFTSFRDDSRGGDSNGDGDTEGSPGDWGGIWFGETTDDADSRLIYCDVYFGGQGGSGNFDAPIELDARANPQITNVKLKQNRVNGIDLLTGTYPSDVLLDIVGIPYMIRGDVTIDVSATMRIAPGVLLKFGNNTDFFIRGGLIADGADDQSILFTSLSDDSRGGDTNADGTTVGAASDWGGIRFEATTIDPNAVLRNCEIYFAGRGGFGNNPSPIVLDARANPVIEKVILQDNRVNGVWLLNQTYQVNIELDITDLPYIIAGDFIVGASAGLRIHPGVLFKMGQETDFFIDGTFKAIGEPNQPIIFTSFRDDSRAGDTDGAGATNGVPGDWGGILFRDASNDAASLIEYAEIYFAGQGGFGTNGSPLVFDNASPKIQNVVISNTRSHGIHCVNSASPDFGGGAGGSVGGNRFLGFVNQSGKFAIFNNGVADVFAKFNYWETTDTTLIDVMIFDVKDDAGRGRVFYQPINTGETRVMLANLSISPFPAVLNSPITFTGTVEVNGQAQQVEMAVHDPVSQMTGIVPVDEQGHFSYTTINPVMDEDTYVFYFGAFGSIFETVIISTPFTPSPNAFLLPEQDFSFSLGQVGGFLNSQSTPAFLGEKPLLQDILEESIRQSISTAAFHIRRAAEEGGLLDKKYWIARGLVCGGAFAFPGLAPLCGAMIVSIPIDFAIGGLEGSLKSLVEATVTDPQDQAELKTIIDATGTAFHLLFVDPKTGIEVIPEIERVGGDLLQIFGGKILDQNIDIDRNAAGEIIGCTLQIATVDTHLCEISFVRPNSVPFLTLQSDSPVDIELMDPNGLTLSKDVNDLSEGFYLEADIDADGEMEDYIIIHNPSSGIYRISVTAEAGANPDDTFSLTLVRDRDTTKVAENTSIRDIPSQPYEFIYSELNSVDGVEDNLPEEFRLFQNYPNPFNPTTTIEYQLPKSARVTLLIYNIRGQQVRTLVDEEKPAGIFKANWNGEDAFGRRVASGIYVYQIRAGDFVSSKKLILMR